MFDYLVYGGYPDVVLADSIDERRAVLNELRNSYAKKDILDSGIRHADIYMNLMKIIADQTGGLLNSHHLSSELGVDSKTVKKHLWVMQKSFHIHQVSPFHQRITSELRKMPKVYFSDLGLRNSLLNNFSPIGGRKDCGALLENYAYLCFRNIRDEEQIKYWRTQNQQEVDFIVQDSSGGQSAYEVKYSAKQFNPSKYKYFREQYPDIPLQCINLNNAVELGY
ncbi:MAG: DUF4143 domain-containing protein [Spartobacteria bacterium]|nr:DUF4143 domain-containing protein [Spartobacteria bacterium]